MTSVLLHPAMSAPQIERWCAEQRAIVEMRLIPTRRHGEVILARATMAPELDLLRQWPSAAWCGNP